MSTPAEQSKSAHTAHKQRSSSAQATLTHHRPAKLVPLLPVMATFNPPQLCAALRHPGEEQDIHSKHKHTYVPCFNATLIMCRGGQQTGHQQQAELHTHHSSEKPVSPRTTAIDKNKQQMHHFSRTTALQRKGTAATAQAALHTHHSSAKRVSLLPVLAAAASTPLARASVSTCSTAAYAYVC